MHKSIMTLVIYQFKNRNFTVFRDRFSKKKQNLKALKQQRYFKVHFDASTKSALIVLRIEDLDYIPRKSLTKSKCIKT